MGPKGSEREKRESRASFKRGPGEMIRSSLLDNAVRGARGEKDHRGEGASRAQKGAT